MSSNFSLLNDLRMVPDGASFAMLLRHAERGELKDGEMGEDCLLTSKGLSDARSFGEGMAKAGISHAFSSPVPRCVDTAKEILNGVGNDKAEIIMRKKLGDYGIYVTDKAAATRAFMQYGNMGVIERFVKDRGLEGFISLEKGCGMFMSEVYDDMRKGDTHNIYLSHDMILIPLITYFTGELFGKEKWLDCLDGFIIVKFKDGLKVIRKGKMYPVLSQF